MEVPAHTHKTTRLWHSGVQRAVHEAPRGSAHLRLVDVQRAALKAADNLVEAEVLERPLQPHHEYKLQTISYTYLHQPIRISVKLRIQTHL